MLVCSCHAELISLSPSSSHCVACLRQVARTCSTATRRLPHAALVLDDGFHRLQANRRHCSSSQPISTFPSWMRVPHTWVYTVFIHSFAYVHLFVNYVILLLLSIEKEDSSRDEHYLQLILSITYSLFADAPLNTSQCSLAATSPRSVAGSERHVL